MIVSSGLGALGCAAEQDPPEWGPVGERRYELFTARLPDADAVLAIAVSAGNDVMAYVCGGARTLATHSKFYCGPRIGSDVHATRDGWRFDGRFQGDEVFGTLAPPDASPIEYVAHLVHPQSQSGLFTDGRDAACATGVISLHDSPEHEPKIVGAWCGETGPVFGQVTPIMPIDWELDLFGVAAHTPSGDEQIYVRPAFR